MNSLKTIPQLIRCGCPDCRDQALLRWTVIEEAIKRIEHELTFSACPVEKQCRGLIRYKIMQAMEAM